MRRFFQVCRTIFGWICLIVGILGLVLPLLPGAPLVVAGLFLLSTDHPWARRTLAWLKERLRKLSDRKRSSPNAITYRDYGQGRVFR
jgi:uncharacterized membrane protein YbaN (DUF454 family)